MDGRTASLLTGLGLGGLVDGVVLHQVLQWHHLISARTRVDTVAGLEENTLADGVFHLASIGVLAVAVAMLARRRVPATTLVGYGLIGWGLFNVLDQLVFHLALGLHHIREGAANSEFYDWSFFGVGVALVVAGALTLRRRGRRDRPPSATAL